MGLAVIFDMDGVLVENTDFHVDSWLMTYKKHGKILTREEILPYFGASNKIFVSHFLGIEDDASVAVIAKEKEELYRQIFNDHIRIPNGLKNLLDELKKKNIPTGVATSAPRVNLDFVLDKLQIRDYFQVLVDESKIKKAKPDPSIYLKAAEELKVMPKNCVVFEDSINGIKSGKSAGMKVIGITTSFPAETIKNADFIINSFHDINLEKIRELNKN